MTTKTQEREALAKIKKIVEGLDEDSYIGMAFEGCFEIAEENIENDWACSMKQNWMEAQKETEKLREIANDQQTEILMLKEKAEKAETLFNQKVETADHYYDCWKKSEERVIENLNKFREQEDKVESLEQEIIKLKAKLYDLICK